MTRVVSLVAVLALVPLASHAQEPAAALRVGFGSVDVTPPLGKKPVYLAGFGKNRLATKVHDPIMARCVVLHDGTRKIAIVSVDVVGLFLPVVEKVRQRVPGFEYVLVSSTHNHEGPDTMGMWGPTFFQSGIDPDYLKLVENGIVAAIQQADKQLRAASTTIGVQAVPELLHDGREPYFKHDDLVALRFADKDAKPVGIVVQWNCHPETLSDKNTEISADYVAATCQHLQEKHRCPVVYLTGTVGGLMTSLRVPVKDEAGELLPDGSFAKTERFGKLLGIAADKALAQAKPVTLTPFAVQRRDIYLPLDNQLYLLAWKLGVLDRKAFRWSGDVFKADALKTDDDGKKCVRTEIARLKLGDLDVACIPGEIYPELVLGKVQDPQDPAADFPNTPIEPTIYGQLKGPHRMIVGLANDELGYIIPKRQWDEKPPFCYGRMKTQYGEVNSLGPETAPLLCEAFRMMTAAGK